MRCISFSLKVSSACTIWSPYLGFLGQCALFSEVLRVLVVKAQVQTCFRREIHLVRGSRATYKADNVLQLAELMEREAWGCRLLYFSFFEWSLSSELHEPCEARKRSNGSGNKTEFLSFHTEENASGYYYLWFMGCTVVWPVPPQHTENPGPLPLTSPGGSPGAVSHWRTAVAAHNFDFKNHTDWASRNLGFYFQVYSWLILCPNSWNLLTC